MDGVFSKSRRRGGKNVGTWGQLGLTGDWAARPISLYGRNSASGTYGFFKEHALGNGDYKDTVKEQPGSASVVQGVTADRFGMGYSGIGYKTSGVKNIALADKAAEPTPPAPTKTWSTGKYPLARFLYVYVNKAPGKELDPVVREFLKFVFSKEGQEIVVKDGYYPLPAKIVSRGARQAQVGGAAEFNAPLTARKPRRYSGSLSSGRTGHLSGDFMIRVQRRSARHLRHHRRARRRRLRQRDAVFRSRLRRRRAAHRRRRRSRARRHGRGRPRGPVDPGVSGRPAASPATSPASAATP